MSHSLQVATTFANAKAGQFLPKDFRFGITDNALMEDMNATLKGLAATSGAGNRAVAGSGAAAAQQLGSTA